MIYAKQHRGVVVAEKGMVAASQPLAVSAGLRVLQKGGNFIDCALAVSAVLCVVEPYNSHIGGDAFIIVYDSETGETTALNASGEAPQKATPDRFPNGIPLRGLQAASVPGLVSAWFALHERWGTIPVAELLEAAIDYAENGYPTGYRAARAFMENRDLLYQFPDTADALLNDGQLPAPGSKTLQPDLAWTLRQIAEGGRAAFYEGAITERILKYSDANDGLFSAQDFANHKTQISAPIKTDYRGYVVHGQPPVSQGHILLQELNIIEGYDLAKWGHNSANALHVQVEAKRLAFADRAAYLGDPKFVSVPMETLLSKPYAEKRRAEINMARASDEVSEGEIDHDTTYFCVADANGNAVSFIQSVFWGFGSGVVAKDTGVLFNNRMTGFSLDPNSPNVLAPGKRTAHTLNAYLVTQERNGRHELAFVGGTPGGDIQVQSNLQVICNMIDFGMNPQEAIEAARWQHGVGVGGDGSPQQTLWIEDRVSERVLEELREKGHRVERLGGWGHGSSYQLIARDASAGVYLGGSDPRCDGHAAGF